MKHNREERRNWIKKLLDYGGFTLLEITRAVRFYELRDHDFRTQRYGWE